MSPIEEGVSMVGVLSAIMACWSDGVGGVCVVADGEVVIVDTADPVCRQH